MPGDPKPQAMANRYLLRQVISRPTRFGGGRESVSSDHHGGRRHYGITASGTETQAVDEKNNGIKKGKWFTLPPFTPTLDGSSLGKKISDVKLERQGKAATTNSSTTTAIKWVMRCCPELPRTLVQKLFRLRQVRRELCGDHIQECPLKRVGAKDTMNAGDRIFLPITVEKSPSVLSKCTSSDEEMQFLHSLVLYKDGAVVVVNKPPGMPVQGGIGIKRSLDELAAKYLRFDDLEVPRLVHRLDRDCSGILVMGRSQLSASALHSIFREETFESSKCDLHSRRKIIQKTYRALVIGSPRRSEGLISIPLGKVVMDSGKSERITVMDSMQSPLAQHAITEYRVLGSSCHGYTWLELSPRTGRKHQLRVHCAEVLGTPIVGDYKYGWQAHRNWKHFSCSSLTKGLDQEFTQQKLDPYGLNLWNGSISDEQPRLHLHCKKMVLPDISQVVQCAKSHTNFDIADLKSIKLDAPLPSHMLKSRVLLNS